MAGSACFTRFGKSFSDLPYVSSRSQHPAWLLLASRRAPLVISCLRTLFEKANDGIVVEDALQGLSELFAPRKAGVPEGKVIIKAFI
ncbi:DUF3375 domain-containing protein [Pseudomonas aeruginosa]|uniref:DUF3375 domain-containing protein n=1 Tax=Pseudomonas aeruginosa TaxID=287 RepID=UPI002236A635|nr:DUF3375 domain-containing protein [Pseudomonas aeruginosa]